VKLEVTPRAEDGTYRIGIGFGRKLWFSELTAGRAAALALYFPVEQTTRALAGLGQLFSGKASVKQVGGPVEIVRQLKLSFEDSLAMAILFLAILSVYLGLFNLLPIPALDGGRLIFLLYAMITRRPVSQKVENAVHTIGFLLLLLLIILVSFGDVMRMFGAR
jgi:regulator of sigma E protease